MACSHIDVEQNDGDFVKVDKMHTPVSHKSKCGILGLSLRNSAAHKDKGQLQCEQRKPGGVRRQGSQFAEEGRFAVPAS